MQEEDFNIVGTASNVKKLKILVSLHIFKTWPVLNDMQSSFPLNIVGLLYIFFHLLLLL